MVFVVVSFGKHIVSGAWELRGIILSAYNGYNQQAFNVSEMWSAKTAREILLAHTAAA